MTIGFNHHVRGIRMFRPTLFRIRFGVHICTALTAASVALATMNCRADTLFWSDRDTGMIERIELDGSDRQTVVTGLSAPINIVLDPAGGRLYWIDEGSDIIQRSEIDGSDIETIASVGEPQGLAIDFSTNKIYWGGRVESEIQRANLDGSGIETVITGVGDVRGLALDIAGGKIYWTSDVADMVQRANLDGSDIQDLVFVHSPRQLALDLVAGKVYWVDQSQNRIRRANLDGTDVENIITGVPNMVGVMVDSDISKLFWTEGGTGKIRCSDLDGAERKDVVTDLSVPYGLAIGGDDILHVPDEYPTIQAAIDAALDGDEVVVAPGTYFERITFLGKAITVRSSEGAAETTIDGEGGSVVRCTSGEGPDSVLEGFTVTGGSGTFNGGGMEINGSSPSVAHCRFVDNSAERGGGMSNVNASPTVISCVFQENSAPQGGGMSIFYDSHPLVQDCIFINNWASEFGGGANVSYEGAPVFEDCTFTNNSASQKGGGMYSISSSEILIGCTFSINSCGTGSGGGGAAAFVDVGDPQYIGCLFLANTTTTFGGAMNYINSTPTMLDCEFLGNTANKGGALAYSYSDLLMVNCLFSGNAANELAGAISSHASSPTMTNCTLSANYAADTGGLRIQQDPAIGGTTLTNCVLWGNYDDGGMSQHAQISMMWASLDTLSVDYSCVQNWADLVPGEGNINADPTFIENPDPGPDGIWGTEDDEFGNLRIAAGSPCIDAADNTAVPGGIEFDLDGNPRFVDDPDTEDTGHSEYGDPPIVDMGSYEYQIPGCEADLFEDGVVDVLDLLVVLAKWGPCPPEGECFGDVNDDGTVDVLDLLEVLSAWGPCP